MSAHRVVVVARGIPSRSAPLLGRFELDQAKALQQAGHTVVLASLDVRSLRRRRRLGLSSTVVEGVDVVQYAVPLGNPGDRLLLPMMRSAWRRLLRAVVARHGEPDVVHAHFGQWGAAVVNGTRRTTPAVVVTEHSSRLAARQVDPAALRMARRAMQADRVIAVSGSLAEVLHQRFGVRAEVVGDVIDVSAFEPGGHNDPVIRIASCANLIERKRLDLLVRAFHRAFEGRTDVVLDIAGEGPERSRLQALIDGLGLGDRVTLLGQRSRAQVAELFATSDLFALLSTHETFGVVYAEAMAAGLPVLAARSGGPEDFVTGDTGRFVPTVEGGGEVEAAAAALRELVEELDTFDPEVIRAVVQVHFSPRAVAERLTEIYDDLG